MKHGDKQTHLLPAFHGFCCTHNLLSLAKLQAPTPKTKNLHFRSDSLQTQSAIQDSQSCAASSSSFATRRGPLVLGGDSVVVSGRRFFGVTCAGFSCPSGAAGFDEPACFWPSCTKSSTLPRTSGHFPGTKPWTPKRKYAAPAAMWKYN